MKTANVSAWMLAGMLLAAAPASVMADPLVDSTQLEQMAASATTPSQHVRVAKQYRLRAEVLEGRADKHEAKARRMEAAPASPTELKWPALARQPWVQERQAAVQLRRAANECMEIAERHTQLGIEALADASDRSTRADN